MNSHQIDDFDYLMSRGATWIQAMDWTLCHPLGGSRAEDMDRYVRAPSYLNGNELKLGCEFNRTRADD